MNERIAGHQAIRDDLIQHPCAACPAWPCAPEAGSYLFPRLPALAVSLHDFVRILRAGRRHRHPGHRISPTPTTASA